VLVNSIETIPKQDWTKVRYEKKKIDGFNVWFGYNSLEGIKNKEIFKQQSFANYEWSIIDLKYKQNSQLLYGKDIRNSLPDISNLKLDYDDILARSLYHLNKSFERVKSEEELTQAKFEFTKAVFKFGFYICLIHDTLFHFTSIESIFRKIKQLQKTNQSLSLVQNIFKEAIEFRRNNKFSTSYKSLRTKFTFLVLYLTSIGKSHRTLNYEQFIAFLEQNFGGLYNIIRFLKKAKNLYYSSEDQKF